MRSFTGRATETEIAAALESLIDARLMLRSGGRYLSLATEPGSEPVPLAGRAVTHNRARWRRLGAAAAAVVTGQIPVGQAFDAIRKRVRWHKERKTAKLIRKDGIHACARAAARTGHRTWRCSTKSISVVMKLAGVGSTP